MEVVLRTVDPEIDQAVHDYVGERLVAAVRIEEKQARQEAIDAIKEEAAAHFVEIFPEGQKDVSEALYNIVKKRSSTLDYAW